MPSGGRQVAYRPHGAACTQVSAKAAAVLVALFENAEGAVQVTGPMQLTLHIDELQLSDQAPNSFD